jgi:hypothetical protein
LLEQNPAQALVGIRLDGQQKANCTKDHKGFRDKPCADWGGPHHAGEELLCKSFFIGF